MIHSHDDGNHHNHVKEGSHSHDAGKNLAIAFFLNLLFCVFELIGGLLTNSIAILSDALHDLGDSFSLGLAWYFQKVSKRKPNARYTYGYKRLTTLSALLNSIVLLTGSGFVLYFSIQRLFHPVQSNAQGMLVLAIFGVLVNGAAVLRLRKGGSLNERVVSLHMMEDVLGWIAVLIASVVMIFVNVPVLDSILSIGISTYILFNVYKNLMRILPVILQGKPADLDDEHLRKSLLSLPEVKELHDLHIWSLDGDYLVLTVHLVVEESVKIDEQQALRAAAHRMLKKQNIQHSTIEIERPSEVCEWCEDH
jgi:cobalt-zinc-cadmium efflux system protein